LQPAFLSLARHINGTPVPEVAELFDLSAGRDLSAGGLAAIKFFAGRRGKGGTPLQHSVQRCSLHRMRSSNSSEQDENEHNHQNEPKATRWVVTPPCTVWPGRKRADEQQYKDDEQNRSE